MTTKNFFDETYNNFSAFLDLGANQLFEGLTDAFVGEADDLRDGTEFDPLDMPRDLYAHRDAQTEWWYYTGHAETKGGDKYGFELCFFKRRTDLDNFGPVPLRLLGNPIYFAHFAITDCNDKKFSYSHKKSANGLFDEPASASEKHYHVRLGDWSVRESHGNHVLRATMSDDTIFEVTLKPLKPFIMNGKERNGVSYKDKGQASRYFSYTRMALEGDLTVNGITEHVSGSAWMDREFGTWTPTEKQKGWDWFSIQFDDNTELMLYHLRDSKNEISDYSSGVFIDDNGEYTPLGYEDFVIKPTGYWKSKNTKAVYPSEWEISVPKFDIEIRVEPVMHDQELDTRGTTMIVYWEGASTVTGERGDNAVKGDAYVELVGYDRSHDNPNLFSFLGGNSFEVK